MVYCANLQFNTFLLTKEDLCYGRGRQKYSGSVDVLYLLFPYLACVTWWTVESEDF